MALDRAMILGHCYTVDLSDTAQIKRAPSFWLRSLLRCKSTMGFIIILPHRLIFRVKGIGAV